MDEKQIDLLGIHRLERKIDHIHDMIHCVLDILSAGGDAKIIEATKALKEKTDQLSEAISEA